MARYFDELFARIARSFVTQSRTCVSAARGSWQSAGSLAFHTSFYIFGGAIAGALIALYFVTRHLAAVICAPEQATARSLTRVRYRSITRPRQSFVTAETGHHDRDLARRTRQSLQLHPLFLRLEECARRLGVHPVHLDFHPDLCVTNSRTGVSTFFVNQSTNLSTRRTRTVMAFVRLALRMMTNRRYLAQFVAVRRFYALYPAARYGDLAVAATTLNRVGLWAWIARPAVARRRTLVLLTIERAVAYLLAYVEAVAQQAIAAFLIAEMLAAKAHLRALLVAMKLFRASDLLLVAATSARLRQHLEALSATIGVTAHVAVVRAAVEQLSARVAARGNLLLFAGHVVPFFAAWTSAIFRVRTFTAFAGPMTSPFADVNVAAKTISAGFVAEPVRLVAGTIFLLVTAVTRDQENLGAGWTRTGVTLLLARVIAAG